MKQQHREQRALLGRPELDLLVFHPGAKRAEDAELQHVANVTPATNSCGKVSVKPHRKTRRKRRVSLRPAICRSASTTGSATSASLLYEAGASPREVVSQMGHTRADPALEIYAKKMNRDSETGARLDGGVLVPMGTNTARLDLSSLLETQNPARSRSFL